jgi:hypothetical protein
MNIGNVYAGIMTADIQTSSKWYQKLFDRSSDDHPMQILHEWNFSEGGILQLVEDKHRAGYSSITLMVKNIKEVKEMLSVKNIRVEQQTESEIAKTITIYDPENNRITFAQNNAA